MYVYGIDMPLTLVLLLLIGMQIVILIQLWRRNK